MAESKNNMVMKGASGKLGDMLVFRQRAGKTFIAERPKFSEDRAFSDEQQEVQGRFADAIAYARRSVADEALKERYAEKAKLGQSAFNVAFRDYMVLPEIRKVEVDDYHGEVADVLLIQVRDVLEVKQVLVRVSDAEGNLLEEGYAEADDTATLWTYTATVANEAVTGSVLSVTIIDTPGHAVSEDFTL